MFRNHDSIHEFENTFLDSKIFSNPFQLSCCNFLVFDQLREGIGNDRILSSLFLNFLLKIGSIFTPNLKDLLYKDLLFVYLSIKLISWISSKIVCCLIITSGPVAYPERKLLQFH